MDRCPRIALLCLLGLVACGGDDTPVEDHDAAPEEPDAEVPDAAPNQAPVADDATLTTDEDVALAITLPGSDPDGDTLTWTTTTPGHGSITGTAPDVTYTPSVDFSGSDTFDVTVSDGDLTDTATVTITIAAVDDDPIASDDSTSAVNEGGIATISADSLTSNDVDPDSTIVLTAVGSPSVGTVTLATGTITFTPPTNFFGTATFTYTITAGAATDTGTVTVPVTGVEDPVVATDDPGFTGTEDTIFTIPIATLLGNDVEVDGQTKTLTQLLNQNGVNVIADATTVTVTPNGNRNGAVTFDYRVSDGVTNDVGRVSITLTAVDDVPIVENDSVDSVEDTPVDIAVADLLADDEEFDGETLTLVGITPGANGTAVLVGSTITFTPDHDETSFQNFHYTVTDGHTPVTGLVDVYPSPVPDAPVAVDDVLEIFEDTPLIMDADLFRIGDPDPDSEIDLVHVTSVTGDTHCSVTLVGTTLTITPGPAEYSGPCTLTYVVTDDTALFDTGQVAVTVTATNDAPVVVNDSASTVEDRVVTISAATLLGNDSDVDGPSALTLTDTLDPSSGSVTHTATDAIYTPQPGFNGTATFSYVVSDGTDVATGTVTVTIAEGTCGDGTINNVEECDDLANASNEDGCMTDCRAAAVCDDVTYAAADVTSVEVGTGRCFLYYDVNATWASARAACKALGGELAVPDDADEEAVIYAASTGSYAWLGVTDWTHEGTYKAIGTGAALTYSFWDAGEPNDIGNEDCAAIRPDSLWNDTWCGGALHYTCELGRCGDGVLDGGEECDDGNVFDGDACSSVCEGGSRCGDGDLDGGEECDDGNLDDDDGCTSSCVSGPTCDVATLASFESALVDVDTGHCYVREWDNPNWTVAKSACVTAGGHLAVPDDAAENTLLALFSGNSWIGVTDSAIDMIWREVATNALQTYFHWAPGEPNNFTGDEDCVVLWPGGDWNDGDCANGNSYICERE